MGKKKPKNSSQRKKTKEVNRKIKKLDELWRDVVILKAQEQCEICGSEKNVQAHHMFSRTRLNIRFNHKNGVALCPQHHTLGQYSAHKNGVWFTRWLEKNRNEDLEEMFIEEKRNIKRKDILFDLLEIKLLEMKEYLVSLKEG